MKRNENISCNPSQKLNSGPNRGIIIERNTNDSWYKDYRGWIIMIMLLRAIVHYLDRVNMSMVKTTIRADFGLFNRKQGLLLSVFK